MRPWITLPTLLLALPLAAQAPEPNSIGIQARLSLPGGNLPDVTGSRNAGIGASLQAELHFESVLSLRLLMGADDWRPKGAAQNRAVQAYHVGVDVVYFLRDEGRDYVQGPYVMAGLAGYTWAIGADAQSRTTPLRSTKACVDVGFGYRLNPHFDVELKVLAGKVEPNFTANTTSLGITYRF